MRKALLMVDTLKDAGIGFVPVPYSNRDEMLSLLDKAKENMEIIKGLSDEC